MGFNKWTSKLNSMTEEEKLATVTINNIDFTSCAMIISWSGAYGFGKYTIYKQPVYITDENGFQSVVDYRLQADSEHMDSGTNKKFLRHLLDEFIDEITIDD